MILRIFVVIFISMLCVNVANGQQTERKILRTLPDGGINSNIASKPEFTWIEENAHDGFTRVNLGGDCYYTQNGIRAFGKCKGGQWGLIDNDNNYSMKPADYDELLYFCPKRYKVFKNNKVGLVDQSGKNILDLKFDSIERDCNSELWVLKDDFHDTVAIKQDLFKIKIENKLGMVDAAGKIVIAPIYDDIKYFTKDLLEIKLGGKVGLMTKKGKILIDSKYDRISSGYNKKALRVVSNGKIGLVALSGKVIIEPIYDSFGSQQVGKISEINNIREGQGIITYLNRKQGIISVEGKRIFDPTFDNIEDIYDTDKAVVRLNGKYGMIDLSGKILLEPKYDYIVTNDFRLRNSNNRVARVNIGAKSKCYNDECSSGKYGLIDADGNILIKPEFDHISKFDDGIAYVSIDGKWGLISEDGKLLLQPEYDNISKFQEGRAEISRCNDKCVWGTIDKRGKFIDGPHECANVLGEEARFVHLFKTIDLHDDEDKRELLLYTGSLAGSGNTELIALRRKANQCDIVLSTYGRGISVDEQRTGGYPNLRTYYSEGRDEETGAMMTKDVTYFWNGKEYEDVTLRDRINRAKKLNDQAVRLLKRRKIEAAIKIWKQISDELHVVDAEILNNLGFAYYELAKQTKDSRHYSHSQQNKKPRELTYYEKAEGYLQRALEKEPERWSALLNIGDLEYDMNDFVWAIKRYDKLLKVKPDYKYADKIRKRIQELKRRPEEIGVEMVVSKYRSGKKDITYTRIDNKRVIRQGYYENGQLRFRENIVDGYENGEFKSWFEDGQVSVVGQQKMGEAMGKYIYYSSKGTISQVLIHKEDGTSIDVTDEYVK